MSLTMSRLVHDALLARFIIRPVPRSVSQTIAIYSYFANLTSQENLIQYRHARDINSGSRLNHFRLLINDPLPPVDPETWSFLLNEPVSTPEENSQVLTNVSLDNSLLNDKSLASMKQPAFSNSNPSTTDVINYKNSDHSERIGIWRKHRLAVKQVSFPARLDLLAAKLRSLIDNNEQLHKDITLDTIKSIWAEIPAYSPLSPSELKAYQESYASSKTENKDSSSDENIKPIIHLTAQNDGTLLPKSVESDIIGTTQIVLDNETNTVVPLEEVLFDRFTANNGKLIQDYNSTNTHHQFYDAQKYTHFNLTLSMLTREPKAITYASNMSLLNKITRKKKRARTSGKLIGEASLVSLRDDALAGFTGTLGFEI